LKAKAYTDLTFSTEVNVSKLTWEVYDSEDVLSTFSFSPGLGGETSETKLTIELPTYSNWVPGTLFLYVYGTSTSNVSSNNSIFSSSFNKEAKFYLSVPTSNRGLIIPATGQRDWGSSYKTLTTTVDNIIPPLVSEDSYKFLRTDNAGLLGKAGIVGTSPIKITNSITQTGIALDNPLDNNRVLAYFDSNVKWAFASLEGSGITISFDSDTKKITFTASGGGGGGSGGSGVPLWFDAWVSGVSNLGTTPPQYATVKNAIDAGKKNILIFKTDGQPIIETSDINLPFPSNPEDDISFVITIFTPWALSAHVVFPDLSVNNSNEKVVNLFVNSLFPLGGILGIVDSTPITPPGMSVDSNAAFVGGRLSPSLRSSNLFLSGLQILNVAGPSPTSSRRLSDFLQSGGVYSGTFNYIRNCLYNITYDVPDCGIAGTGLDIRDLVLGFPANATNISNLIYSGGPIFLFNTYSYNAIASGNTNNNLIGSSGLISGVYLPGAKTNLGSAVLTSGLFV
jgi:hypothetical protein